MTARRRTPRPRRKRWPLGLSEAEWKTLTIKARAHGVSRPEYVRALINGDRPGAAPGSDAAKADTWWDSRKPSRRAAIWRNHQKKDAVEDHLEDHPTIYDAGADL